MISNPQTDKISRLQQDVKELREYMEDVFTDQNDKNFRTNHCRSSETKACYFAKIFINSAVIESNLLWLSKRSKHFLLESNI